MNLVRRVIRLEQCSAEVQRVRAVTVPPPVQLDRPGDVLALLAEQANAVRADQAADPMEKARTLGFIASTALRAMEARDLTARLEAIERVLKLRRAEERESQKQRGY
jgi:hypothetical protein